MNKKNIGMKFDTLPPNLSLRLMYGFLLAEPSEGPLSRWTRSNSYSTWAACGSGSECHLLCDVDV